jgi:hypothetical protein
MASLTFEGGLNEMDASLVKINECIQGYNYELNFSQSRFAPRLPFDNLGTATNAGSINGIIQLIKNDNTETTLVQSGDTVYLWDGTTTFTSKGSVNGSSYLRGSTWSLGGYSVITDLAKLTVVKKWDGTSLTSLTTGLGNPLYAKYGLVYLGRMWFFNVKAGTDTPHLMVASAYEDPTSYDTTKRAKDSSFTTGNEAFYMTIPDLLPINGADVFFNTLIVSTENGQLWKLTGSSSTDFSWTPFYAKSCAGGSGTNVESMVNIGNDILYMKNNGVIESLSTTQKYGDVTADDLTKWIKTQISGLSHSIAIYDQERMKVYFFAGSNKVLVLFKDILENTDFSPWSIYQTDHSSNFNVPCAIYMRKPGGTAYYVYFGDSAGNLYQMEGTSDGDGGTTNVNTYRKSKFIELFQDRYGNIIDPNKQIVRGRVYYRRLSSCNLLLDFEWADDYAINRCTVPLEGPSTGDGAAYYGGSVYYSGSYYYNVGFQFSQRTSTKGFSPVGRGPGFYVSTTIQSNQTFDVLKLEI